MRREKREEKEWFPTMLYSHFELIVRFAKPYCVQILETLANMGWLVTNELRKQYRWGHLPSDIHTGLADGSLNAVELVILFPLGAL
jgi:hypothetical protein